MNEIITAIIAGVSSILVALIGGYYATKAARAKTSNTENAKSKSNTFSRVFLIGLLAFPVSFLFAYAGNSLTILSSATLENGFYTTNALGDSLDAAFIGVLMCILGFIIGIAIVRLDNKE